ncbi:DNA recombination protein RmuC homolog [Syntrophobacter sp. SbD1]|nr:DNA recombination protein RmuC homolog [Syntrophobacter sp. SbD1]
MRRILESVDSETKKPDMEQEMQFLSGGLEYVLLSALAIIVVLLGFNVISILILLRRRGVEFASLIPRFDSVDKGVERCERSLRDEIAQNREEATLVARQGREESGNALRSFGESFQSNMTNVRDVLESKLKQIQEDNSSQLEKMRATVDEKLQGTLEKRLGESFKQVSERLEQVHKGLGEMQVLATGVGDLKRLMSNVKTRGVWGEIQLETLLDQILTPEQYDRNVRMKEGSAEAVEFAIKLPGGGDGDGTEVWLPIDAKFPIEDYHRLFDAQESCDPAAAENAAKMLSVTIRNCAKTICDKYLNPPVTTDFGIMFLPTEGLYAEVIRRTGLVESLQRECRVIVAGPSTLAALLNSLQMGFRTLAIQKRSSEVWKLLGAVKTEFGNFGATLEGVKKKLDQASNTMDDAAKRSRAIERKLRNVEELPSEQSRVLLEPDNSDGEPEEG